MNFCGWLRSETEMRTTRVSSLRAERRLARLRPQGQHWCPGPMPCAHSPVPRHQWFPLPQCPSPPAVPLTSPAWQHLGSLLLPTLLQAALMAHTLGTQSLQASPLVSTHLFFGPSSSHGVLLSQYNTLSSLLTIPFQTNTSTLLLMVSGILVTPLHHSHSFDTQKTKHSCVPNPPPGPRGGPCGGRHCHHHMRQGEQGLFQNDQMGAVGIQRKVRSLGHGVRKSTQRQRPVS